MEKTEKLFKVQVTKTTIETVLVVADCIEEAEKKAINCDFERGNSTRYANTVATKGMYECDGQGVKLETPAA